MFKALKQTPGNIRVVKWVLVAVYTFILPSAIIIYRSLVEQIGESTTGKVPVYSVVFFGTAYLLYGFIANKDFRHLLYIIPGAIIAYVIIKLEPNPNKHIHIPEYVLMAWLLFWALSKDYQGKGIFVLIFICGAMLGVVDELEQGVHPRRFYGWSDMTINSASMIIGILTIMGLVKRTAKSWDWVRYFRELQAFLWLMLFGFVGAVLMCIQLFQVQAAEAFLGVYPLWLLVWNVAYLIALPAMLYFLRGQLRQEPQNDSADHEESRHQVAVTTRLWVFPVLTILFYMHAITVFVALFGLSFR
jgi:hypothetical protein